MGRKADARESLLREGWLDLDQYVVLTEDGGVHVYRNWFHDYSLETVSPVLAAHDFAVQATWSDLAGTPYEADTEWIGIAARVHR